MNNFTYITGPCGMDSEEMYLKTGRTLYELMQGREFYYKCSYDKRNRTSIAGARGIGLDRSVEAFKEVKRICPGIKLVTDIHDVYDMKKLVGVVDVCQIAAFLCRQSDLLIEAAKNFPTVFVKKMQWLGPKNVIASIDKIKGTNPDCQAWLGDRGTALGYDKLIVDFTIVDEIKKHYDKFILDASHCTQRSRHVYGTQSDIEMVKRYYRAAPLFNYDGAFLEVHPQPEESASDKESQVRLVEYPQLLKEQDMVRKCLF